MRNLFVLLVFFAGFISNCGNKDTNKFDLERYKILRNRNKDSFLLESYYLLKVNKLNEIDSANVYTQLGHYYYDDSEFDSAYFYYQKAYSLRNEASDNEAKLNSLASLADVLTEKGEINQAILFYEEAITKREKKDNLCDDCNNLASLYSSKGKYSEASLYFQKAINLANELQDSYRISKGYYNYSLLNSSMGDFDSALYYLNKSNKIVAYSSVSDNKINFLLAKANIYYDQSNFFKSKELFDSALNFSLKNKQKRDRIYALEGLSLVNEKLNNFKKSIEYLKWQIVLSDSLFSENIQNSIASLKVKYDTERKTQEIHFLNKENSIQRIILIVLILSLLLLLFTAYYIYKNQQNKGKRILAETNLNINKILEEVNQTKMEAWADGQEKERSRLAAELHDRLGGLLVMASHHFTSIEKKFNSIKKENEVAFSDFRKIINNAIIEVRELSKDISSNLVSKLGLSNAMLDLKEKIETATGLKVNLTIHDSDGKIPLSSEIALFRIAQEALNNIMKHAQAKEVQLSLTGNQNSLVLMIEDDGKGFDTSKANVFTGMGLRSMQKRMTDIGGSLNIDSKLGRGTVVVAEVNILNNPNDIIT